MKKIRLTENELISLIKQTILEDQSMGSSPKKDKKKPNARCIPENVLPLDEIAGLSDDFITYGPGIQKRRGGIGHLVDSLGLLNNIRLNKSIKDGGTHLAYEMMNHLNKFRNKNYFDETNGQCLPAMEKIVQLYKENEHGTELVKDIEKVLDLQSKDDDLTPSARAKEYLKQCINLIKGI